MADNCDGSRRGFTMRSKLAMALLAFFVCLEGILQVGALATALLMTPRAEDAYDKPHVLCLGDSFTYGQGATTREGAYPAVLESIITNAGHDIAVLNGGWPGRTSRDLIEMYAGKINENTKALCILVGTNDSWKYPDEITQPELNEILSRPEPTEEGFAWQFRTKTLLMMMFGFESQTWLRTGNHADAGETEASTRNGGMDARTMQRREQGQQLLTSAGFQFRAPKILPHDAAAQPILKRFWPLMAKKDYDAARSLIVTGLAESPDSPALLRASVTVLALANQPTDAPFLRLAKLHQEAPTPLTLQCLMQASASAGKPDDAMALAKEQIAQEPDAMEAWNTLQTTTFDLGLWAEFERAATQTIELMAESRPAQSAWCLNNYSTAIAKKAPERAAQVAIASFLMVPDAARTRLLLRKMKRRVKRRVFEDTLASIQTDDAIVAQYRDLLDEVYAGKTNDTWESVLTNHIKLLNELAAKNGTAVVLVTYPFLQEGTLRVQQQVAEDLGIGLAHVTDRFTEELKTRDRTELFVPDGHCNDGGYALIAEVTAPLVLDALKN